MSTKKGYVIGRAGFAKISAVEGISIESDEASIPSRPTTPKIDKGNT